MAQMPADRSMPPSRIAHTASPPLMVLFGFELTVAKLIAGGVFLALAVASWFWIVVPGPDVVFLSVRRVDALVVAQDLRRSVTLEPGSNGALAPGGDGALLVWRSDEQGQYALVRVSFTQRYLIDHDLSDGFFLRINARQIKLTGTDRSLPVWFVVGLPLEKHVQVSRTTFGIKQPVKIVTPGLHHTVGGLHVAVHEELQSYVVSWDPPAIGVRCEAAIKDVHRWFNASRWDMTILMPLPEVEGPYELLILDKPAATLNFKLVPRTP